MVFVHISLIGVYVENLTEYVVHSPKEVLNLLKVGRRRLVFAETQMNRASSRLFLSFKWFQLNFSFYLSIASKKIHEFLEDFYD